MSIDEPRKHDLVARVEYALCAISGRKLGGRADLNESIRLHRQRGIFADGIVRVHDQAVRHEEITAGHDGESLPKSSSALSKRPEAGQVAVIVEDLESRR